MPTTGTLDRTMIVAAAVAILNRDGLDGLSMRRLASELGSKPMTLYQHVQSKSELLSLVLRHIAADIRWEVPTGPPRERLIQVAVDVYEKLSGLAWLVPILRIDINIGAPTLVLADRFITAAQELGASPLAAVSLLRSLWYLVSSELLWQCTVSDPKGEQSWFHLIDPATMPTFAAALPSSWADYSAAYDLRAAIEAQVDGAICSFTGAGSMDERPSSAH